MHAETSEQWFIRLDTFAAKNRVQRAMSKGTHSPSPRYAFAPTHPQVEESYKVELTGRYVLHHVCRSLHVALMSGSYTYVISCVNTRLEIGGLWFMLGRYVNHEE